LDNIEKLQHVIDPVVKYVENLRGLTPAKRLRIGRKVLASVRRQTRSKYERVCLLSIFTKGREFDNEEQFERLYQAVTDTESRREITLALGRARKTHWFMQRRAGLRGIGTVGSARLHCRFELLGHRREEALLPFPPRRR